MSKPLPPACSTCDHIMEWKRYIAKPRCTNTTCASFTKTNFTMATGNKDALNMSAVERRFNADLPSTSPISPEIKHCKYCGSQYYQANVVHSNWRSQLLIVKCGSCDENDFGCIKVDCHSDTRTLVREVWNNLNTVKILTEKPAGTCHDLVDEACGECDECSTFCDVCGTWYWKEDACEQH